MPKIIISYRRRDSEAMTGRIFDWLVARYGRDAVFRDIDNIPPGIDFRAHIAEALDRSEETLAVPERHAKLLEVDVRQLRQDIGVDFTRAKERLVLSEPETFEPTPDIHGRTPRAPNGSSFG